MTFPKMNVPVPVPEPVPVECIGAYVAMDVHPRSSGLLPPDLPGLCSYVVFSAYYQPLHEVIP
jgi:hypothetical protein